MSKPTTAELVAWLREQSTDTKFRMYETRLLEAAADALSATPTREELLAMVEAMREAHTKLIERIGEVLDCTFDGSISESEHDSDCIGCQLCKIANQALALTPTAALADLKARVRRDVLEEVAQATEAKAAHLLQLESQSHSEGNVSESLESGYLGSSYQKIAAELRWMAKEGE
jgi:predicted phage gp36 major capsid-like protein